MTLTIFFGVGGHALLLTAIVLRLAYSLRLRRNHGYPLALIILALTLIPMGQLAAAQFSRGLFGDLSIVTILLLARFILLPQASKVDSRQLFTMLCITGTLFYPAALGLGMTDPYQWGYLNSYRGIEQPLLFLAGIITMMIIAGRMENNLIMLCISMALLGFMLKTMESRNIWDYLIDPIVFIYGLASLGIYLTKLISVKLHAR